MHLLELWSHLDSYGLSAIKWRSWVLKYLWSIGNEDNSEIVGGKYSSSIVSQNSTLIEPSPSFGCSLSWCSSLTESDGKIYQFSQHQHQMFGSLSLLKIEYIFISSDALYCSQLGSSLRSLEDWAFYFGHIPSKTSLITAQSLTSLYTSWKGEVRMLTIFTPPSPIEPRWDTNRSMNPSAEACKRIDPYLMSYPPWTV